MKLEVNEKSNLIEGFKVVSRNIHGRPQIQVKRLSDGATYRLFNLYKKSWGYDNDNYATTFKTITEYKNWVSKDLIQFCGPDFING